MIEEIALTESKAVSAILIRPWNLAVKDEGYCPFFQALRHLIAQHRRGIHSLGIRYVSSFPAFSPTCAGLSVA